VLELPGYEHRGGSQRFSRTLKRGQILADLMMRVAPEVIPVALAGKCAASLIATNGSQVLHIRPPPHR